MQIHKEGFRLIAVLFVLFTSFSCIAFFSLPAVFFNFSSAVLGFIFVLAVWFFRSPGRKIPETPGLILSPADGTVVALEEVEETEYFHDRRLKISIFMSPLDVHLNRYPVSGKIVYSKYHPGKYLMAFLPKSSTDNEHQSVVISSDKSEILVRQIAGILARRIVCYAKPGNEVRQGDELGFIKFGSRVDIFLPAGTKALVRQKSNVKGGVVPVAAT